MRYVKYGLVIAAALALAACGGGGGGSTVTAAAGSGTGVISLNGGVGVSGTGGNGGAFTTFRNSTTMVHGDLRFRSSGTVNAGFSVPSLTPDFGSNHATIVTDTTVVFKLSTAPLPAADTYFVTDSDFNLHLVNSTGTAETIVTGLTVNAGRTLRIPNDNGHTDFAGAVAINGTVTNTPGQEGGILDVRSGSFLVINSGGTVTTTPTTAGAASGALNLLSDGVLINQGTVESNGTDSTGAVAGGTSGGVTLQADTFLYNTGRVSARGGNNNPGATPAAQAGFGGPIQLLSGTASIFTSGAIDAGGGDGTIGGDAGPITLSGGTGANAIGRAVVKSTVTVNGGIGSAGNGGNGGAVAIISYSGGIVVNAAITANGGESKAGGNGGSGGTLSLNNRVGSDTGAQHEASPQGIKVAGNIRLNGGQGAGQGGIGGTISLLSDVAGTALPGFANVEFFGYQAINLNGGDSTNGTGGDGGTVSGAVTSSPVVGVDIPAGRIANEVAIHARGGENNPGSTAKNAAGGKGGAVQFTAPQADGAADDETLLTNSGAIDVSGGAGNVGGTGGSVTLSAYEKLANSAGIRARGGNGVINGVNGRAGGDGGSVNLFSTRSGVNSGAITVSGGDGTAGNGGNAGTVSLVSGNKTTNSGAITAAGGDGNKTTGTGGAGGIISIFSEWVFPSNSGALSVAGGGGSVAGARGNVLISGT